MKAKILGLLAVGLLASPAAMAITYHYVGGYFQTIGDNTSIPGTYTTSMRVTASITLGAALGSNFEGSVTPLAFAFSDGRQTITDAEAEETVFTLATGASGEIFNWFIGANYFDGTYFRQITSWRDGLADIACIQVGDSSTGCNELGDYGTGLATEGVWSVSVPEPGTFALLGLGLAGLGLTRRRKAN